MKQYHTLLRSLIAVSILGLLLSMLCARQTENHPRGSATSDRDSLTVEADSARHVPAKSKPDTRSRIDRMQDRMHALMQDLEHREAALKERESKLDRIENELHQKKWLMGGMFLVGCALLMIGYWRLYRERYRSVNQRADSKKNRTDRKSP